MSKYSDLVVFIRPWEIPCYTALARDLKAAGIIQGKVRYVTMWKMAATYLSERMVEGEELVFLPERLQREVLSEERMVGLRQIERNLLQTTGNPLKLFFAAERFRPSTSKGQMHFIWQHVSQLDPLIPPGALVMSQNPDHFCYWLAADLAVARGGAFLGLSMSGRPSHHTQLLERSNILRLPFEPTDAHRETLDQLRESILSGEKPSYMHRRKSKISVLDSARYRRRLIEEMKAGNYFVTPSDVVAFSKGSQLMDKTRWQAVRGSMKAESLESVEGQCVYFPLHLDPEAATLVYSPFLNDQAFVIDTLAKSMPSGVKLLLKENPKMWGRRSAAFYQRASASPEVVWLDPNTPSQDILDRCDAVVTLTGTTALEAVLIGKPVALLGAPPFASALTSIPRIGALHDIPATIEGLLDGSAVPSSTVLHHEYARYIANLAPAYMGGVDRVEGIDMPTIAPSPHLAEFALASLV